MRDLLKELGEDLEETELGRERLAEMIDDQSAHVVEGVEAEVFARRLLMVPEEEVILFGSEGGGDGKGEGSVD